MRCLKTVCAVTLGSLLAYTPPLMAAKFVRVLVMAGQSNMGGTGSANDAPPELLNQTNVWYDKATPSGGGTTNWTVLGSGGALGPEAGNGCVVATALPDEQIAILKDSAPATSLKYWHQPGQAGFISLTDRIEVIRQRLDAQVDAGEISGWHFAGFFWMQGEAEANAGVPGPALAYFDGMTDLVHKVRLATGVTNLPIVVGRTHGGIQITNQRDLNNVRSNQVAFAEYDPYADWVDIDDVGLQDKLHLNSPGSITLGRRMGLAYLKLVEPNPCIRIEQAADQADPTDDRVVRFIATVSKPVTGFDGGAVVMGGTAGATTAIVWRTAAYNGTQETYCIAVSGMTNDGDVTATVPAGAVMAGAYGNFPSYSEDNRVAFGVVASITNLLVHDDCNQPGSPLLLAHTGFGWRQYGWVVQGERTQGYVMTTVAPMIYSNLLVNAPHARGGDTYVSTGRDFDCLTALKAYHTEGDLTNVGRSNDELWVSFLARRDHASGVARLALCQSGITWVGQGRAVTVFDSGGMWALELMGDTNMQIITSVPSTVGQTFLMVLRIRFAGVLASNIVDLFINPTELGDTPPTVPTATLMTTSNLFKFARIHWYPGSQPNYASLDEFRLGLSYAAVTPVWPTSTVPVVATASLPVAQIGQYYSGLLRAVGGNGQLTWALTAGTLPAGLDMSSIGTISGVPQATGSNTFTVQVTDATAQTATREVALVVVPEPIGVAYSILLWLWIRWRPHATDRLSAAV